MGLSAIVHRLLPILLYMCVDETRMRLPIYVGSCRCHRT